MQLWQSVLLGVVEGVTEFLPVSSTAHLLLTQRLLGMQGEAANAFAISIQAGAILAVLGLYRHRVGAMLSGALGQSAEGRHILRNVVLGFLPAAVLGKLFDRAIERHLLGLWPVVAAWFVGGVVILLVHGRAHRAVRQGFTLDQLRPRTAALIGLAQCLAMWPGTSRSLATILAGVLLGLELGAAVEFSFLLGLVTLSAAAGYKCVKGGAAMLHDYGALHLAVGFAVATLSAAASVRWMVAWLQRRGLAVFGWYRLVLAAVVTMMLLTKVVTP